MRMLRGIAAIALALIGLAMQASLPLLAEETSRQARPESDTTDFNNSAAREERRRTAEPSAAAGQPQPTVAPHGVLGELTPVHALCEACPPGPCEATACIRPEQRHVWYRSSENLPSTQTPGIDRTITIAEPGSDRPVYELSLNEALQLALRNAEIIRVVTGTTAVSTGNSIYDAAITNTQVDQARGRFDPTVDSQNGYTRSELPTGVLDPVDPNGARIDGFDVETFRHSSGVSVLKPSGGTARLGFNTNPTITGAPLSALNPQTSSAMDLSYTQPLLRGRGASVNNAPIVIALLDTERSFYQLKGSVQDLVNSLVEAYWGIVFSRTDIWARKQQIEQLDYAYKFFEAQLRAGRADLGDTSQAQVSLANFRASLIAAEAELINREESLFNALGLPPGARIHIVPTSPPLAERIHYDLPELVQTAEARRPDIAQLKLQVEADCQRLQIAENSVLPQLDANALYRWNGLQGETPSGNRITTQLGEFADWQVGVNFAAPLGLRTSRASLRQNELLLARNRALLQQQVHAATHEIAQSLRNLEQAYAQYEAFRVVRKAAEVNLDRQFRLFQVGGIPSEQINFVNVLLAVTDWGNSVSNEALALTQYNSELARLTRAAGTILEDNGVWFAEEHYASIGPHLLGEFPCYPESTPATPGTPQFPDGTKPAEESFNLNRPIPKQGQRGKVDVERELEELREKSSLRYRESESGFQPRSTTPPAPRQLLTPPGTLPTPSNPRQPPPTSPEPLPRRRPPVTPAEEPPSRSLLPPG